MTRLVIAAMTLIVSLGLAFAADGDRCKVTDPTGTPLNVRDSPNGKIVGTLANGVLVAIVESKDAARKALGQDRRRQDETADRLGFPRIRLLLLAGVNP